MCLDFALFFLRKLRKLYAMYMPVFSGQQTTQSQSIFGGASGGSFTSPSAQPFGSPQGPFSGSESKSVFGTPQQQTGMCTNNHFK